METHYCCWRISEDLWSPTVCKRFPPNISWFRNMFVTSCSTHLTGCRGLWFNYNRSPFSTQFQKIDSTRRGCELSQSLIHIFLSVHLPVSNSLFDFTNFRLVECPAKNCSTGWKESRNTVPPHRKLSRDWREQIGTVLWRSGKAARKLGTCTNPHFWFWRRTWLF